MEKFGVPEPQWILDRTDSGPLFWRRDQSEQKTRYAYCLACIYPCNRLIMIHIHVPIDILLSSKLMLLIFSTLITIKCN